MDTLQKAKIVVAEDKLANMMELSVKDEGHTLGNLLATELQKDPEVSFAAYKIPHPLQNIMKLKVAVEGGVSTPSEALVRTARKLRNDCMLLYACIENYHDGSTRR